MSEPEKHSAQDPSDDHVNVNIYSRRKFVFSTVLSSSLEFGRQRVDEMEPFSRLGDRVVIAETSQRNEISRRHIVVTLIKPGHVKIENCSQVMPILLDSNQNIEPGNSRDMSVPTRLTVGDRMIQLTAIGAEEPDTLNSFDYPTVVPGSDTAMHPRIIDAISSTHSTEDTSFLVKGLLSTISVFHQATASSEFLNSAAQAMIDVVGLETAAALLVEGDDWKTECMHASDAVPESAFADWQPSRTILNQVRDGKKTYWRLNDLSPSASLLNVRGVIAAPILNADGGVIGALYGDRRRGRLIGLIPQITETEAMLVELLASSAAAGLARLKQEHAAIEAQVLFDQFFTSELSAQLKTQPDLLLGKDSEVTLLFCTIHGFSQISEQLGARLTIDWINDVMNTLSDCVAQQQGTLVDTFGDELVAMWGAPLAMEDHAARACGSAIAMNEALPALYRRWEKVLERPVELSIGIHTGTARVGNIGSSSKFKYGPLGQTLQIGRTAQAATESLKANILVTQSTAKEVEEEFSLRRLYRFDDLDLELYELATSPTEGWEELKRRYETAWSAFESGDYPTATRLLAKILADNPNDRPSLQLLSVISEKLNDGNKLF